jgi:chromosome segregation ATPase
MKYAQWRVRMKTSLEQMYQKPRVSVDRLARKIDTLRARLTELEEQRIKLSLKIVMTTRSIGELKEKQEKIDEKIFESLMVDYTGELHEYEKKEERLIGKINVLEDQLELFEEYKPLLEEYETTKEKMTQICEKIKRVERKLNYM